MAKKHVLIIDDDKDFAKLVQAALDPAIYEIKSATDGEQGMTAIRTSSPNVILLDMRMPRMDGIQFLMQMRAEYPDMRVPIIVTTNDASIEKISQSVEFGVRSYIVKSNESMEGIKRAIEAALK